MKAIITDLDGVLWKGILSEDRGRLNLHYGSLLMDLMDRGILVAVASKNNIRDVEAELREATRIFPIEANWGPKSESVKRILQVWNILPEDVLVVDDNPLEIREILNVFPTIKYHIFDSNYEEFETGKIRDMFPEKETIPEDKLRLESIKSNVLFNRELKQMDTEEFYKTLDAKITVRGGFTPRAFELIGKTNQFNINGRKDSEHLRKYYLSQEGISCFTFEYSDRFGDLGIVGVVVVDYCEESSEPAVPHLTIHEFCLSCRAVGRRIEFSMVKYLDHKFPVTHEWEYVPTEKNGMAQKFMKEISETHPYINTYHEVIEA